MYYIRKLSGAMALKEICAKNNNDVPADIIRKDFGTKSNTLSFWRFQSFDDSSEAVKAIVLASSSIEKTWFIVLDDNILDRNGIEKDEREKGKTGYCGVEDRHINLCKLTYGKIGRMMDIYREVAKNKSFTIEKTKEEVKDLIREAASVGRINYDSVQEELIKDIVKYNLDSTGACQDYVSMHESVDYDTVSM